MIDVIADRIVRKNPFLCDWSNYGIIDIFNPVATAQYQHSVTIPTKPGMMHDFRDLRFFQPDGTEIPFWNESKTDGSTSFNWIKPYSPSQRKAYVFYGNREAVSQSNGDKVFELFDDFNGSAVDATKWDSSVNGSLTIASGYAALTGNGSAYTKITSKSTFAVNYALRCSVTMPYGSFGDLAFGLGSISGTSVNDGEYFMSNTTPNYTIRSKQTSYTDTNVAVTQVQHTYDIIRNGSTDCQFFVDGSSKKTESTKINASTSLNVVCAGYPSGASLYVHWVLVRKYAATEPACQLNQSGFLNPEYR